MIAAVFDVRGHDAARSRLESLGKIAGFTISEVAHNDHGAVMIYSGALPVSIDRAMCVATLGHAISHLDSPTLAAAENISGDVAMMAPIASGLLLARGRFGGRPIYFSRNEHGIIACSRLEPLVASLEKSPTLERAAIATLLTEPCALASRTPYLEIERLGGGEAALVAPASTLKRPLRSFAGAEIFRGTPEDAAEELRAQIDAAVARAIVGKKKIAVMVSGGVDSSSLLASTIAAARGASVAEVEAISLYFEAFGDDRPHLQALTEDLGITPVRVSPDDCTDSVVDKFTIDASPFVWPALGWLSHVGRLARSRGADLVLTGTGGDEIFGLGMDSFLEDALRGNPISALKRTLAFRAQPLPSARNRVTELLLRPLAHRVRDRFRKTSAGKQATFDSNPTESRKLDALARAPHLTDVADMRAQLEIDSRCMRVDPFLDDNLARFLATLPRAYFTHGNRHRGLLVHAMRRRLPDSVRLREDKGAFGHALDRSFTAAGGLKSVEHLLSMRALEDLGLVRGAEFRRAFSDFLNDRAAREFGAAWLDLWPPLVLEAFLRSLEARAR